MVVHDMRNPTSSIEFGLSETLNILNGHFERYKSLKNAFQKYIDKDENNQNDQIEEKKEPRKADNPSDHAKK